MNSGVVVSVVLTVAVTARVFYTIGFDQGFTRVMNKWLESSLAARGMTKVLPWWAQRDGKCPKCGTTAAVALKEDKK